MDTCKLCRRERDLRESQIIPELMYWPHDNEKQKALEHGDGEEEVTPKLVQRGFRERLLCDECESFLHESFEAPNVPLWRALAEEGSSPGLSVQRIELPDSSSAAHVSGFDYLSFKLLLLSVLWRASVSQRTEFAKVSLGPHEETIRQMLLSKQPGNPSDYPCLLFLYLQPKPGIMIPPFRSRVQGHNTYHFVLTRVRVDIMVSRHAGSHPFSRFALKEDGSFLAILLDHSDRAAQDELVDPAEKN